MSAKNYLCPPTIFWHDRKWYRRDGTLSKFYVDGEQWGFSLEDTRRENGIKIPGVTAIRAGVYQTVVNLSTRFGRYMTNLLDVFDFAGVRHHGGNKVQDTEGCLLTAVNVVNFGKDKAPFAIQGSLELRVMEYLKTKIPGGWKSDADWAKLDNVWTIVTDAKDWREQQKAAKG